MGYSVGYSRLYYIGCSGVRDSVPYHYAEETEEDFGGKDTFFYKYSSRHPYTSDPDKGPAGRITEQRYGE